MFALTEEEFDEAVTNILHSTSNCHDNYKKRFSEFLDIKYEWVLYFRNKYKTRDHNTNNYSEATMRIIKDIILHAVALVDYCCSVCKVRLLNFASGRKDNSFSKLNLLENETKHFNVSSINKLDNCTFLIPSLSNSAINYEVNSDLGICTCP